LVIAMLLSLSGALKNLFRDQGKSESAQTFKWLAIRVSIAVMIILVVAFGVYSGQLTISAPWTGQY